MAKKRNKAISAVMRAASIIGLAAGLCVLAWPSWSEWQAQKAAESVITQFEDAVGDDETRDWWMRQAEAYNASLIGAPYDLGEELLSYDDQLSWKGKPYMGWIHIPSISLKLPIYHGTADDALAMGVGHLEGRSLPVGGEGSLCVLEGHSGLQTARMFDDLRRLDAGSNICIWTLGEPFAYRVYDWGIYDPDDMHLVLSWKGEGDTLALVTCTTTPDAANPKGKLGVNDKRLVMWCEHVEYDESLFAEPETAVEAVVENTRMWPGLAAFAIGAAVLAVAVLSMPHRRKKGSAAGTASNSAPEP